MSRAPVSHTIQNVLVIGAGATGSCAAFYLRKFLGPKARIVVLEKARGPGGRMTTNHIHKSNTPRTVRKHEDLNGLLGKLRADMGSQYLSLDSSTELGQKMFDFLVKEKGVCAEMPHKHLSLTKERPQGDNWRHLCSKYGGVNDALKVILDAAEVEVRYTERVKRIDPRHEKHRIRVVNSTSPMNMSRWDAVVIATAGRGPADDGFGKILGEWTWSMPKIASQWLSNVIHNSNWCLALYLPISYKEACDTYFGDTVEQVIKDTTLQLLCYQSKKTDIAQSGCTFGEEHDVSWPREEGVVVVAHTTHAFAHTRRDTTGKNKVVVNRLLEQIQGIMGLPAPDPLPGEEKARGLADVLLDIKVINWKQNRVTTAAMATGNAINIMYSGDDFLKLTTNPTLVLAGDYFGGSTFQACLSSGYHAAQAIATRRRQIDDPEYHRRINSRYRAGKNESEDESEDEDDRPLPPVGGRETTPSIIDGSTVGIERTRTRAKTRTKTRTRTRTTD